MKKILLLATLTLLASLHLQAQYNIQLLGKKTYTGQNLSGSWGWNDTINHKEYALVGTTKGLSIVDITTPSTPTEVKFINGKQGTWRECQTYKNYAYITEDNQNSSSDTVTEGILIYNLSQLPGGKADTFKGTNPVNDYIIRTHSLFIDDKGFLYLNGGDARINGTHTNGVVIYDLKPNPMKPRYVGYTLDLFGTGAVNYVHDCYVRNDTMYQAHIYNNRFTVWDVKDRSNPIKIQDFATAYSTVHNMWLSDNSKTLFVSHEEFGLPAEAYDVSDISNIHQLCEFRVKPTNQEILHNVHVLNDFVIGSYYSDGVAVFDASDPTNVIPVGYYDTQPTSTQTENGVWGAWEFYKSGVITLSDMRMGLYVVKPNYVRGARIQGVVTDTNTTQVLPDVTISFVDTAISATTSIDGIYKTGSAKAGLINFKAVKAGYITKYFSAQLVNGRIDTVNIQLRQIPVTSTQRNSFCEGRSFTLPDGRSVNAAGTYTSDIVLPSGKDSIITTILTQKNKSTYSFSTAICQGQSYKLPGGRTVSSANTYSDTLANAIGCDSIITVNLSVNPVYSINKQDSIYRGGVYHLPNGATTSVEGIYVNNLLSKKGCDSIITIDLKVVDTATVTGIRNNTADIQVRFVLNNNELTIINHTNDVITELGIYNSMGVPVNVYYKPENTILLPSLPKDVYIIRAITNNTEQQVGKVVIY